VRNRQKVLSLPADEICAPMREPDRALPWRRQLEAPGHEYRRVLPAHRAAARCAGPQRLRLAEIALRTLRDAGNAPAATADGTEARLPRQGGPGAAK
jgi:hypothetical protein